MTLNIQKTVFGMRARFRLWQYVSGCVALMFMLVCGPSFAQENAIQSIDAMQEGAGVVVKVTLKASPAKQPMGFAITNPSRVVVDLADTANALGSDVKDINLGDVRNVRIVEVAGRTRLVFDVKKTDEFCDGGKGQYCSRHAESISRIARAETAEGCRGAASQKRYGNQ